MTKTAMIRARTTPAVKADTERIFQRLGISTSEAINLFLAQVKMRKGLPFDVRIPNKATLKAMKDADEGKNLTTYDSVDDFFKKIGV
jgi:DNA-damage-inducible protein J